MHIRKNLANGKFELVKDGAVLLTLDTLNDVDALASAVLLREHRVVPSHYPTIN